MTDYAATAPDIYDLLVPSFAYPGRIANAHQQPPRKTSDGTRVIFQDPLTVGATHEAVNAKKAISPTDHTACKIEKISPLDDWFDSFHVIPRVINIGNLLTAQTRGVEIHSAFRTAQESWNSFDSTAVGSGVTLTSPPTFPLTFEPHSSVSQNLSIALDGPAQVDGDLLFLFSPPQTIPVTLTLERITMFVPEPEQGYVEALEFLTRVHTTANGKETRHALRAVPRQVFQWDLLLEDGRSRSSVDNILFGWQSRLFGIPVWHDATKLTAAVTAGATSLTVDSTDFRDFRDDDLVLLYTNQYSFEAIKNDRPYDYDHHPRHRHHR